MFRGCPRCNTPDESLPKIKGTTPTRTHARTDVHREQWSPQHSPLPRALYSECFESPPGSPLRETIKRHPSVYHEIAVAEAGIARGLREVRRALREGARSVAEDKTMLTYHPSSNALIRQVQVRRALVSCVARFSISLVYAS